MADETAQLIASFLRGKSPDEVRRIWSRLEREARFDVEAHQEVEADEQAQLSGQSVDDLTEALQAAHSQGTMKEMERLSSVLRGKLPNGQEAMATEIYRAIDSSKPVDMRFLKARASDLGYCGNLRQLVDDICRIKFDLEQGDTNE